MPDSSLTEWAALVVQEAIATAKCKLERVLTCGSLMILSKSFNKYKAAKHILPIHSTKTQIWFSSLRLKTTELDCPILVSPNNPLHAGNLALTAESCARAGRIVLKVSPKKIMKPHIEGLSSTCYLFLVNNLESKVNSH